MKHELDYACKIILKDDKEYIIEGIQGNIYTVPYEIAIDDCKDKIKDFLSKKNIDYFKVKEITIELKYKVE